MSDTKALPGKQAKDEIVLNPTSLPHIFLCDIDDSGLLKEIMVVKKFKDGSIYYIEIDTLHNIDKGRIKKIVSSQHASKYEAWELLSQAKLSNGMNALDFFHSNNVKVKRPRGARASAGGLETVASYGTDKLIGSDFTNPAEAELDKASGMFPRQEVGVNRG
jgi:hypothetical protein